MVDVGKGEGAPRQASDHEVRELIRRARGTIGGTEFLVHCSTRMVAEAFEVPVDVVNAARSRLGRGGAVAAG